MKLFKLMHYYAIIHLPLKVVNILGQLKYITILRVVIVFKGEWCATMILCNYIEMGQLGTGGVVIQIDVHSFS